MLLIKENRREGQSSWDISDLGRASSVVWNAVDRITGTSTWHFSGRLLHLPAREWLQQHIPWQFHNDSQGHTHHPAYTAENTYGGENPHHESQLTGNLWEILILNRYIKEILKELSETVPSLAVKVRTKLTMKQRKLEDDGRITVERNSKGEVMMPRYNCVTTHTARRSGITNMYLTHKYTILQMMHVSGHKTQKTFMDYIKLSSDEIADEIDAIANQTKMDVFWKIRFNGIVHLWILHIPSAQIKTVVQKSVVHFFCT